MWAASIADGPSAHAWPFNYAAGFIAIAVRLLLLSHCAATRPLTSCCFSNARSSVSLAFSTLSASTSYPLHSRALSTHLSSSLVISLSLFHSRIAQTCVTRRPSYCNALLGYTIHEPRPRLVSRGGERRGREATREGEV